jgi:uncharacterized membrane protein YdjX (TVP38/TMEM64 family)
LKVLLKQQEDNSPIFVGVNMTNSMKKAFLVGLCLVSIIALIWYFGLHNYVTLASLQANRAYLESIVTQNYVQAVAIFIAIYTAVIALAIPGVPPLTMIGGFLFGCIPAGIYAIISATIGTTISFLLMRYLFSNMIRGKYAQKLDRFNQKIATCGAASYLLTLQLMGLIPYFVINALAALTNVSTFTFIWTTFVGSIPIIFIYAFAGRQLYLVESVSDIFSPSIIALLVFLVFVSLLPLLLKSFGKDKDF